MSQRIILFVEGRTERLEIRDFLKRWLDSHLDSPIGIAKPIRFNGWGDMHKNAATKAHLYLDGANSKENIAVIGLMDLFGPDFYPKDKGTVEERYKWAKAYMENLVNRPRRYHQFFAVHETEAWLLSDPSIFQQGIGKALITKAKNPETVNFNAPPSKLLNELYMREMKRRYEKTVQATNLFPKLSPDTAAEKCPYLKKMLEELLELVNAARHGEMEQG